MPSIKPLLLDAALQKKIDEAGANTYVGYSDVGVLASEAKWHILRLAESGTVTSVQYASVGYDQVWDNRTGLTYL